MRNDFLAPARRPLLAGLAGSRLLVAFDYDGVLAPLVTAPDGREMRAVTVSLLEQVARRYVQLPQRATCSSQSTRCTVQRSLKSSSVIGVSAFWKRSKMT